MKLENFEFVEPKQVAPGIPHGQQLAPIDKMAQLVIPRMVDKINYLTARVDQLAKAAGYLLEKGHIPAEVLDKQQALAEEMDVLKVQLESLSHIVGGIEQRIEALEKKEPTVQDVRKVIDEKSRTKVRKKPRGKANHASVADYDPDKDVWKPKKIAGMEMVANLVDCVLAMGKDQAEDIYAAEVVDFVYGLSNEQKEFIKSIS